MVQAGLKQLRNTLCESSSGRPDRPSPVREQGHHRIELALGKVGEGRLETTDEIVAKGIETTTRALLRLIARIQSQRGVDPGGQFVAESAPKLGVARKAELVREPQHRWSAYPGTLRELGHGLESRHHVGGEQRSCNPALSRRQLRGSLVDELAQRRAGGGGGEDHEFVAG